MSTPHSPWRSVSIHAIFSTDPAPLWQLISPFDGLPALAPELIASGTAEGHGVGMTRTLHLRDGATVIEDLIAFHPETFRYVYAMHPNPGMPWEHYFCAVQAQALGAGQTHLAATGFFQPRDGQEPTAREALSAVYTALFTSYARALGVTLHFQSA